MKYNFCFCVELICARKEQETNIVLCVRLCAPTCMFVMGWGLWPLCAATLLEEEGGSFDHEEALAEAGKAEVGNDFRTKNCHQRAVYFLQ